MPGGLLEALRQLLLDAGLADDVRPIDVGCVIGAHVGPGTTLLAWIAE